MKLTAGQKYDVAHLELIGWTEGDGTGSLGYQMCDYFRDGVYLGPDQHDIEPVFETPITYDIDEAHGSVSGTILHLYLIPADESDNGTIKLSTFAIVGSGQPEPSYHGRWCTLPSPNPEFVQESLVDKLREHEDLWREIDGYYLGSQWDGNNHRGHWHEEEWIDAQLVELDLECETYWEASEWLYGDISAIDRRIVEQSDATLEQIAADIVTDAEGEAHLDSDEIESELRYRCEHLVETLGDREDTLEDLDEDEVALLAACRRHVD